MLPIRRSHYRQIKHNPLTKRIVHQNRRSHLIKRSLSGISHSRSRIEHVRNVETIIESEVEGRKTIKGFGR
jgi:hypothetical protein